MQITDVRIRRINSEGKMKAIVSITFDDEFVVHDIKIIDGQNGLFIAMPSRKMGEGDFRDIAHPLVSETRNKIKEAIFAEYEKVLKEQQEEEAAADLGVNTPVEGIDSQESSTEIENSSDQDTI